MKREIVEVAWLDSMSARGWRSEREAQEMFSQQTLMYSTGYLFRKDKKKIALIGSVDTQQPEANVNHYHEIPMSVVKSIRRVK